MACTDSCWAQNRDSEKILTQYRILVNNTHKTQKTTIYNP
jgi:hypothetical protein